MKDKRRVLGEQRKRRHRRIRRKVRGTAERPRLVVTRSLKHIAAQLVDDDSQKTLAHVSSTARSLAVDGEGDSVKMNRAVAVGTEIARKAQDVGATRVVFDRAGRLFHGRVKAVAEAARKGGLEF